MMRMQSAFLAVVVVMGGQGSPLLIAGPRIEAELPTFTPERETAALQFVAEHHPELAEVLTRLQKLDGDQYQQAIRQIFQEADKLAMIRSSDEKLYKLMLDSWKVKSRIEVVAARLASSKTPDTELEAELKRLLYQQVDLNRQTIEHNYQRALATVKVMENNIKLLGDKREEIVERRFRTLTGGNRKAGTRPPVPPATSKK